MRSLFVWATLVLLVSSALAAQVERPLDDPLALTNWQVPLVRIERMDIAIRLLHPESNALPTAASHFIQIVPCRVYDSRVMAGGAGPIVGGTSRTIPIVHGPCSGIPANAAGFSVNVTVTNSSPGSYAFITAYSTGSARPNTATLNFAGGMQVGNAAIVPAGTDGAIDIYASTTTEVVIDINGYFVEGVVTSVTAGVGSGLTGGGTGDVTIGLATGGVSAAHIATNAVTAAKISSAGSTSGQVLMSDGSAVGWQNAPGGISGVTAGPGLAGGGTAGIVTLGVANGGIGTPHLADGAVTGAKISSGHVVKGLNGATDGVTITGTGGAIVTTAGNTITVNTSSAGLPPGSIILGAPNDTTLITAGYTELDDGSSSQSWKATNAIGAPTARAGHTAVWTGTKMIVWGGEGAGGVGGYVNTGGIFDPTTNSWTATSTTGAPLGRKNHTAIWTGTKMVVWGGYGVPLQLSTGGIYDPATNSWTPTSLTGAPQARSEHTAVWTGTKMIVWGGRFCEPLSGGIYDPATNTWTYMRTMSVGDYEHTAVWTGTKMIVWGGLGSNIGGIYDPATDTWTATSTSGAPAGRSSHTAVWTGTKMIVWGGYTGSHLAENTGGIYDPATDTWTATSTSDAPAARYGHRAVWTGTKMIVWGGQTGPDALPENSGGIYDPATNTWTATSTTGAPSARYLHTAVWMGTTMIVWGGSSGAGPSLNTGGVWKILSMYVKN